MTTHEELHTPQTRPPRFPNGVAGLHRLEAPAIVAATMLVLTAGVAAYGVIANLQQSDLLQRLETAPLTVTAADLQADADRAHAVNTTATVLVVLTGLAFIAWTFQAYRNVRVLGRPRRWASGWAIGWWFVPVANLVAPLRITHEVNGSLDDEYSREWNRTRWILNAWWTGWIVMLLLGVAARNHEKEIHGFADAYTTNALFIARNTVGLVAALLALAVVIRITRRTRATVTPVG